MGNKADVKPEKITESGSSVVIKPCPTCELPESLKPRHNGSKNCESGSIASGGNKSHCTCDICF